MRSTTDQIIDKWIREATAANDRDQRDRHRYPFFRPIAISIGSNPETKLSAFSRDISPAGMGLLHTAPVEPQHVQLTIPTTSSRNVQVDAEARWCSRCAEGWYISGGRFMDLSVLSGLKLGSATAKAEVDRRLSQRQPFFRPVTVNTLGTERKAFAAFSREISPSGIGLFHSTFLEPQHVWLRLDPPLDIGTQIQWCAPCGEGWYTSGGSFTKLTLEELPARRP